MDPSVVSFPGNGQILVSLMRSFFSHFFFVILVLHVHRSSFICYNFVCTYSVKVYLVDRAVAKRANRNYLAIMWYSNREHRNQMWSNIRASSELSKWPSKVLAARHFVMDKLAVAKHIH